MTLNAVAAPTLTFAYTHLAGLHTYVYRKAEENYDATRGGASRTHSQLTIIGILDEEGLNRMLTPLPKRSRVFRPSPSAPPAVFIRRGQLTPTVVPVIFLDTDYRALTMNANALDPADPEDEMPTHLLTDGAMAGGNLAASSDSRLSEAAGVYLPAYDIHDRSETRESRYDQYSMLPRWGRGDRRAMPEATWEVPAL